VIAARLARDSGKEQRFRRDGGVARGGAAEAELLRRGSGRSSGGRALRDGAGVTRPKSVKVLFRKSRRQIFRYVLK
jgi:hypothetical protein